MLIISRLVSAGAIYGLIFNGVGIVDGFSPLTESESGEMTSSVEFLCNSFIFLHPAFLIPSLIMASDGIK